MNQKDFSFTYSADGYMLQYKSCNIGGAGVMLPRQNRLSPKQRSDNLKDFKANAEREIDSLLRGYGQNRFIEAIVEIEEGNV